MRGIWRHLETSGGIWRHLEASGGIRRYLECVFQCPLRLKPLVEGSSARSHRVDQLTKHLHRMVKSCRAFDPTKIYSIDSNGKVFLSLKPKLTYKVDNMTFHCESVVIAGQSDCCNDPQPSSRIVGNVSVTFSDGRKANLELSLPRRTPCRRISAFRTC